MLPVILALSVAGCDEPAENVAPAPAGPACEVDATVCDAGRFMRCAADRSAYVAEDDCASQGLACDRDNGCVDPVIGTGCGQGEAVCRDGVPWRCGPGGEFEEGAECPGGRRCVGPGFCAACDDGDDICIGSEVWRCGAGDDPGGALLVRTCDPRVSLCDDGQCVSLCGVQDRKASYQGCQFWAVDLENVAASERGLDDNPDRVSPADAQFAVAVGNVASTGPSQGAGGGTTDVATVSIGRWEDGREKEVAKAEVPPGGVKVFELEPRNVEGSGVAAAAYRIRSDLPVVAYQFNPLNNDRQAFSNDASMLLPQTALGDDYVVTTGDAVFGLEGGITVPWGAFVAVVGTTLQPVNVTVRMRGGFDLPRVDPDVQVDGQVVTARLNTHEVLSLRSQPVDGEGEGGGNLSGVRVQADGPVAVFSGNVATLVPHTGRDDKCCADHLEEQLLPTSAWGRTFLAAGAMVRNPVEPEGDAWRVTAGEAGASLTWLPSTPRDAPTELAPFESVPFETDGEGFLLEAGAPVQLVHFVKSSHHVGAPEETESCNPELDRGAGRCNLVTGFMAACDEYTEDGETSRFRCAPVGDPAMTLVPPRERWRSEYVFLTPADYAVDFAVVLAPQGVRLELDGEPVDDDEFEGIVRPGSGPPLGRLVLQLSDGAHELTADAPVGLMVFGYDRDVSYGYPGGLDLEVDAP